ncbi:V-type proton ATPase subunit E3 [Vitis vinifera]|uniref:V-type proton ATPase subunit E3 n=1 Tax=Vitis vinifera TaxID=29760 RepID=A0A438H8L3_VITVI|nr:V-type proton ATPase subunit E3 [Vitis vinifera]
MFPCSEYSMQLNASRIKVLQAQDDLVNSMKEAAGKELLRVSDDTNGYKMLLKGLIVQSLLRLKEPAVLLRCREIDLGPVESVLGKQNKSMLTKPKFMSPKLPLTTLYTSHHLPVVLIPTSSSGKNLFCLFLQKFLISRFLASCKGFRKTSAYAIIPLFGTVSESMSCHPVAVHSQNFSTVYTYKIKIQHCLYYMDGKIVCENTLDARLDVVFRQKLPEVDCLCIPIQEPELRLKVYVWCAKLLPYQ